MSLSLVSLDETERGSASQTYVSLFPPQPLDEILNPERDACVPPEETSSEREFETNDG